MPVAISIDRMRACVQRELGMRQAVYPRWVRQGKMRPAVMHDELERMAAVLEALTELEAARKVVRELDVCDVVMRPGHGNGPSAGGEITFLFDDPLRYRLFLGALDAWRLPRVAPLTMGTQNPPAPAAPGG